MTRSFKPRGKDWQQTRINLMRSDLLLASRMLAAACDWDHDCTEAQREQLRHERAEHPKSAPVAADQL